MSGRPCRKDTEELFNLDDIARHIDVDLHARTVAGATREIEEMRCSNSA